MKVVKADGTTERELLTLLKQRSGDMNAQITQSAAQIIELVRAGGDDAVRRLTEQYDGVAPENIVVNRRQIEASLETRDSKFVYALYRAADNIRDYHARQKREGFINARPDGVMMGQRVRPLKRVGLYVPGGTAAYPSTVLMNAIPAKIAGVEELVMVTPPAKTGLANPNILAAAAVAGVDKIYLMGGAQAVAALAYGTETVQRVDKIVGPGNAYVAAAKKLLYGTVDIDMIAGPSEILIIADGTANPKFLAADLMSQAEHDVMASAILLTTSEQLAKDTIAEINRQKSISPGGRSSPSRSTPLALSSSAIRSSRQSTLPTRSRLSTWSSRWTARWTTSAWWKMPGPSSWGTTVRNRWATTMRDRTTSCRRMARRVSSPRSPWTVL